MHSSKIWQGVINSGLIEFADDTELFRRANTKQSQEHLTQLSDWEKKKKKRNSALVMKQGNQTKRN